MQTAIIDKSRDWTIEDYLLLGEMNKPCELINGELIMSPSPTPYHQSVCGNLYDLIKIAAKQVGGKVFFAPIDLYINTKNVFQPDLLFLSKENLSFVTQRGIEGPPDLIIEVISASNVFVDRNIKKKAYLNFGVKEYWIVDPGNKTLEIYLTSQTNHEVPNLYLVEDGIVSSTILTQLSFDLKEIFVA
jgi:Uma2 family endonuclease